jgi:hypothetical protein
MNEYIYRKARKVHRCIWCGEPIEIGLVYASYTGMWQGDFQYWKMHRECLEVCAENDELEDGFMSYEHERPIVSSFSVCERTRP